MQSISRYGDAGLSAVCDLARRPWIRTMPFLWMLLLLGGMAAQPCRADVAVDAAYVFNFLKFVEWPATSVKQNDKIRLCVIGGSELQMSLAELNGRKIGEHELQMEPRPAKDRHLAACHVLYIGSEDERRVISIIRSLDATSVLTISDMPDFVWQGGGVGLLLHGERARFEVNLAATRKAGLRLSGQLLNLASNIVGR